MSEEPCRQRPQFFRRGCFAERVWFAHADTVTVHLEFKRYVSVCDPNGDPITKPGLNRGLVMATFILVPGAWHGAWAFDSVVPLLQDAGHTVHAATLTGLDPDDDEATVASANLDRHADDVLQFLDRSHFADVTLVGHSYGGMVISAVADRAEGRVSRLVYLDAYVPRNGDSCWSLTTGAYRRAFVAGAADTGYAVRPPFRAPHGGEPRRRPHPLASLVQSIRLTGAVDRVPRRDFIYCSGWEAETPFADLRARLSADRSWHVHDIPTSHNAMREDPTGVAALLDLSD